MQIKKGGLTKKNYETVITESINKIQIGRKGLTSKNYETAELDSIPKYYNETAAFNYLNKNFREKKGLIAPISNKIYNNKYSGIGALGRMEHNKRDYLKLAGNVRIPKERKAKNDIEFDEVAVEEYKQYSEGGTLKGLRITDKNQAKREINFINKKYNRGSHVHSGLFRGGLNKTKYEEEQIKKQQQNIYQAKEEDDEFESLQSRIQEQQTDTNIKISSEGL